MIYEDIKIIKDLIRKPKTQIYFNNILAPKVEIKNSPDDTFMVKFIDKSNNQIYHYGEIGNNCWISCNISYYKDWLVNVVKNGGEEEYNFDLNLNGKSVLISFESKALGDNLSWIPYVEEFRKKHNCKVICSTFWNHLFKTAYPEIDFVNPGTIVDGITSQYRLGWFYNYDMEIDFNKHPNDIRLQPMQKTASDILGIDYTEIRPRVAMNENVEKENLVCLAIHGTCQAKYWNNPEGWQKITDYLKSIGYRVMIVSKEEDGYMGNYHPQGAEKLKSGAIDYVIETLQKAKLFIGIGSGLSWLSWATGTKTCIISGFSYDYTEPSGENIIRIKTPEGNCTGCFNDFRLDPSDWNWCPVNKNTENQFICSKSITPEMVIEKIKAYL